MSYNPPGLGFVGLVTLLGACAPPASNPSGPSSIPGFEEFRVLTVLDDANYGLPRFDPSSARLALVEILSVDDFSTFKLLLYDLASGNRETLIDERRAVDWGHYGAFPVHLEWLDSRRIVVSVSDGDVGTTKVEVDLQSGDLSETYTQGEIESVLPSEQEEELASTLRANRPDWPQLLVDVVAGRYGGGRMIPIAPGQVLFQKRYDGEDKHLWHLDIASGTFTQVLSIPDHRNQWLSASIVVENKAVLLFWERDLGRHELFLIDQATPLDSLSYSGWNRVRTLSHVGGGDGWDLVQVEAGPVDGVFENPVFSVDSDRLRPWASAPGLIDLRLAPSGDLLATTQQTSDGIRVEIYGR